MTANGPDDLAARLRAAYGHGGLPPFSDSIADIAAAYAVQAINTRVWEDEGCRRSGFKIGMTSPAAQRMFACDCPDSGVLFVDASIADGGVIARERVIEPRIEGEIALLIGEDIREAKTADALASAIAGVAPAIEIADSRIGGWQITIRDTIADNASAGLYMIGTMHPFDPTADLAAAQMTLTCGTDIVSRGTGAATMGGPLMALAWLCGHLSERSEVLRAGDIVLTGALGPPLAPKMGAAYRVDISGIGAATVTFG